MQFLKRDIFIDLVGKGVRTTRRYFENGLTHAFVFWTLDIILIGTRVFQRPLSTRGNRKMNRKQNVVDPCFVILLLNKLH